MRSTSIDDGMLAMNGVGAPNSKDQHQEYHG